MIIGGGFYGFSVVLPHMIAEFGWSRAEASMGYSIMVALFGLSSPLIAVLIVRIQTRLTIALGGLLVISGSLVTYFASNLYFFYLGAGVLLGTGLAMSSMLPGSHLIAQWFQDRRALAVGLFMASGGLGAFVFAPLFTYLIELTDGWRVVWLSLAVIGLLTSMLSVLFVREKPEDLGLLVDGKLTNGKLANGKLQSGHNHADNQVSGPVVLKGFTRAEAVRTSTFWMILFVVCVAVSGNLAVASQVVMHLTDLGNTPLMAATALGVVGVFSTLGRLSSGFMGDRIDPRLLMLAGILFEFLGILLLVYASHDLVIYTFSIFYGLGFGMYLVAYTTLVVNYFGNEHFARIYALLGILSTVATSASPILAGLAYDALGSYQVPFFILVALGALACVITFIMQPPGRVPR
jgi:MFS family permease